MAADILAYKATVVPVGDDQLQHLELARETVRRFNYRFGDVFPEPQPRISKASRIMGLDGQGKMSKSKGNTIALFEERDTFWNKLRGAFTDPQRLRRSDPGRPEICNIYTMHKALSSPEEVERTYRRVHHRPARVRRLQEDSHGRASTASWCPCALRRAELDADPGRLQQALADGAGKARRIASETLREVREVMGLGGHG